jgi:hypothetical protein
MPVPEAIESTDVRCQCASRFQDIIDGPLNDRHQGIRINRNLAFVRKRELVTTLGKDIRQRVPGCIKKQCSRR